MEAVPLRPLLVTLLLVAAPALAGCLDAATSDADAPPSEAPLALAYDAHGCIEVIALFLLDFDHLARFLPDGFTPRDAQVLMKTPAPVGRGAAFVTTLDCDHLEAAGGRATLAEGGILVEPPALAPARELAPGFDFYAPEFATDSETLDTALAPAGVATRRVQVAIDLEGAAPAPLQGSVRIEDAQGALAEYAFDAPARDTLETIVRLWQPTQEGVALFELDVPAKAIAQGAITSCTLRADWPYTPILDAATCAPGDALAIVFVDQGWDGTFHRLVGARVT